MSIWSNNIRPALVNLHPSYFALVMATGIVSLAAHHLNVPPLAWALLWINIGFYLALWLLFLLRVIVAPKNFFGDFADFNRGYGFFTIVAGTGILGNQFAVILKLYGPALWLWYAAIALWLLIGYTMFLLHVVKPQKPPLDKGINGGWLVAVVAAQSVSALGAWLSSHYSAYSTVFLFTALGFFFAGIFQYLLIITLIFYRWLFFEMKPEQMEPPYWINLGAVAISTLAAALLAQNSFRAEFLAGLHGFLVASTIFAWSAATWWLPLHIVLGFWRHPYSGLKISYSPQYWSLVFPLGMYTTCTFQLFKVTNLDFIWHIAHYFYPVAIIAWTLTFLGMLKNLASTLFRKK